MNAIRRIGILGLGAMGAPMARHLVAKGYNVTGHDPVDTARRAAGAISILDSPCEVAKASDLVIVVVGFDHQVEHALFGAGGVMEAARPGLVIAIGSTIAPRHAKHLAERAAKEGVVLLDAPLARGEQAAIAGKLLLFGAGDETAFEACRPAFSAFASDIFHFGGPGVDEFRCGPGKDQVGDRKRGETATGCEVFGPPPGP